MFGFKKKKRMRYEWADTHDANKYIVIQNDNWFMTILFNGETTVSYQRGMMNFMVYKLNQAQ